MFNSFWLWWNKVELHSKKLVSQKLDYWVTADCTLKPGPIKINNCDLVIESVYVFPSVGVFDPNTSIGYLAKKNRCKDCGIPVQLNPYNKDKKDKCWDCVMRDD